MRKVQVRATNPFALGVLSSVERAERPWGYYLEQSRPLLSGATNLLHINAGAITDARVRKDRLRSWLVVTGRAAVICQAEDGSASREIELAPGVAHTSREGWVHRLKGITECDVIEVVL